MREEERKKRGLGAPLLALAGFAAAAAFAAALGSRHNPKEEGSDTTEWYRALDKPRWTPPDWVFPVAWTPLYALIAASGWRVWRAPDSRARSRALVLWGTQLGLNAAWTPLFFGRRSPEAGLVDVGLLLPSIAAYTVQAAKVDKPAAWMMAPYLGWVSFATALNADIVRRRHAGASADDALPAVRHIERRSASEEEMEEVLAMD